MPDLPSPVRIHVLTERARRVPRLPAGVQQPRAEGHLQRAPPRPGRGGKELWVWGAPPGEPAAGVKGGARAQGDEEAAGTGGFLLGTRM